MTNGHQKENHLFRRPNFKPDIPCQVFNLAAGAAYASTRTEVAEMGDSTCFSFRTPTRTASKAK